MWCPPGPWCDHKSITRRACNSSQSSHTGGYALEMGPFDVDAPWLRCALHAHTTNSDGELAPDLLVRHYEWAGYDVLAITDHWARTVEASTRNLLVIPSADLAATGPTLGSDAH